MEPRIPIILFSGMAADERLFHDQLDAFPNLRVQRWLPPLRGESLREYAARMAELIDDKQPCLVGEASFGGVVAIEVATHLRALGCILIGSIRSPRELPWRLKLLYPLAALGPDTLGLVAKTVANLCRKILPSRSVRWLHQLSRPDAVFERWAICALLCWRPNPTTKQIRVFHIHGTNDQIFPVRRVRPDVVVPYGEHALPVLCPDEVNEFIADVEQIVIEHDRTDSEGID